MGNSRQPNSVLMYFKMSRRPSFNIQHLSCIGQIHIVNPFARLFCTWIKLDIYFDEINTSDIRSPQDIRDWLRIWKNHYFNSPDVMLLNSHLNFECFAHSTDNIVTIHLISFLFAVLYFVVQFWEFILIRLTVYQIDSIIDQNQCETWKKCRKLSNCCDHKCRLNDTKTIMLSFQNRTCSQYHGWKWWWMVFVIYDDAFHVMEMQNERDGEVIFSVWFDY